MDINSILYVRHKKRQSLYHVIGKIKNFEKNKNISDMQKLFIVFIKGLNDKFLVTEEYILNTNEEDFIILENVCCQTNEPINNIVDFIVYQCLFDHTVWVRKATEFFDGRFEVINNE